MTYVCMYACMYQCTVCMYVYVITKNVCQAFIVPCLINTGISVRKGKGRYRDTHIVTFAPRYLLDNRSTHKLAFAQREFARGKVRNSLLKELFRGCSRSLAAKTHTLF